MRFDRGSLLTLADWLAAAVAVALPWSTSATGICIAIWLVAVLSTFDGILVKREIATAAGGLPTLLWCLAAIGMLWADVSWFARFDGLGGFNRLLVIPLLLAQFRRSDRGALVLYGFFVSLTALLVVSYVLVMTPGLTWRGRYLGVPVHDDIFQNSEFAVCAFAILGLALAEVRKRRWPLFSALLVVAALFLGGIVIAFPSRIVLFVLPCLALLLGWRQWRWRGLLAAFVLLVSAAVAVWSASSGFRLRVQDSVQQMRSYFEANDESSTGTHVAFLRESIEIIAAAPIIGHGTGSIAEQFRRVTAGKTGAAAVATVNPHNQTFAVAIQLGLIGTLMLWSMWIAHFNLFRVQSNAAWFGTVVVVDNIVSSTAHSHLFDFGNGWLYVFGVGVLGGMTLRERDHGISQPKPHGVMEVHR